ncbi:MAG: hypothetical protein HKN43_03855 [Rhodothermales bacterium]|nr:hypothetical protein [Rhodothermales bacterium]
MNHVFSESDHKRIEESVARAESRTSGEIVPYLVTSSDAYSIARWRSGMVFLMASMAICYGIKSLYSGWDIGWLYSAIGLTVVGTIAVIAGVLAVELIPALKRLFVGRDVLDRMVYLSAMTAFVEEEVFKTVDRTGILIFMSTFERRVRVVGDEGINSVVEQEEWAEVVQKIVAGFQTGNVTDGIVAGIDASGDLLERHGVEIAPGDTDELPNRLRIRKRM